MSKKVVLKIVGNSAGGDPSFNGKYLTVYTPNGFGGNGLIATSVFIREAKLFNDSIEALNCWRQVSKTHPVRPDGKPNRPLTAYTVELVTVGDET